MPPRAAVCICVLAAVLTGCATLGPTPGSTGISAVPSPRAGAEAQLGFVPGYYLSQSVTEEQNGDAIPQAQLLVDLGTSIGAPGLIIAGRAVGEDGDTQVEPMVGYRRALGADRRVSVAGIVHGTKGGTTMDNATYEVTRGGVELVGDVRMLEESRWAELHIFGTASLGYVSATGSYCAEPNLQYGTDCPAPPEAPEPRLDGDASGVFPTASIGVALDLGRHRDSAFHVARLSASLGAGTMPTVVGGEQRGSRSYTTIGLAVTIGFGSAK